jgi:membrane associated rhomboid family serine protease
MFFLPRLAPLVVLALVGATIVALVLDASVILIASGAAFGVLLMAVLFNLYEGLKR